MKFANLMNTECAYKRLIAILALCLGGCAEPKVPIQSPPSSQTQAPPKTEQLTPLQLRYQKFRQDALKLQPRMSQETVIELLGQPDRTSASTYGTNTPKPWQGVAWEYTFGGTRTRFVIVFQHETDGWIVNSWDWPDP